jgi:A/G-specific adenine glycosylase
MAFLSGQLIKWYNKNKRDLPWRKTHDPYKIWVSEIIFQQTRIDQGTEYYNRFMLEFPKIELLAKATPERVMKLWQGLGYYTRARNLHYTAKEIVLKFNAQIPDMYDELIRLKGIGDYTACAILSIAFGKPYAVVDGNVIRVISRVHGINKPVDDASVTKQIKQLAKELMPVKEPGTYNQAIMEFGALQCKPQNPDCSSCCLKKYCLAFKKEIVKEIPFKNNGTKVKNRFLNYFLIGFQHQKTKYYYIHKRTDDDIWKNLYDLPCIETAGKTDYIELQKKKNWKKIFGKRKPFLIKASAEHKHKLSHQTLHAVFYIVTLPDALKNPSPGLKEITIEQFHDFPVPRLIEKFLVTQEILY